MRTIYATIGDLFAWLSMAGLILLITAALARRPISSKTGAPELGGAPVRAL